MDGTSLVRRILSRRRCLATLAVVAATGVAVLPATAAAQPARAFAPSEKIFPATTRGWVSVSHAPEFRERFDRTQYGMLLKDPSLKPFIDSVRRQAETSSNRHFGRLGITFEELLDAAGGECAVGAVESPTGRLSTVMLVDTTGRDAQARALVEKIDRQMAAEKGAKAAAAKHPDIKLNEPGVFYHVETPEKSAEAVASAQNANSAIQGWAFIGGWPLFTTDALKWAPGSIKVASCDALPAQLDYVRSGHVEALFAQDCYGWGYKSVEILLEKIVNGKAPADPRIVDPLTEVTKANVEAFAGNWSKWLAK